MKKKYRPIVLLIIDGFGVPEEMSSSTWSDARRPNFAELEKHFPFTTIQASGLAVGLPWGVSGNSEVGHLTIGAGKIINNYLPRISSAINDESFFQNETFKNAIKHIRTSGGQLHFIGLYSTGTVHAYFEHLHALLDLAKQNDLTAYLHLFTDGKDAPTREGGEFFAKLGKTLRTNYPKIKVASVIGRGYAMDRNGNWTKTEKTYDLLTSTKGNLFGDPAEYIKTQYDQNIFDANIEPGFTKTKEGRIQDNDSVIFFNFREDSVRQTTQAFVSDSFSFFPRQKLSNLYFVTMTEYDKNLPCFTANSCPAAFKSAEVENPLAKIISENNLSQLHIAETEKYAHITYFLNGGEEKSFPKENRVLVPSPSGGHYSLTPEMSTNKITENVIASALQYDFIAVNFANADMVGHTGDFEATVKAIEKVDECVGRLSAKILEIGGALVITSDHGNAEEKIYKFSGERKTEHSLNPVPFFLINQELKNTQPLNQAGIEKKYKEVLGTLSDVAPTVVELLGLNAPKEMTGKSLIEKIKEQTVV